MVTLSHVHHTFNRIPVFEDVSLEIVSGEFVSLVGASGSGKTTLMRMLFIDLIPDAGTIAVGHFSTNGMKRKQVSQLRRKLGIIFQDFKLLDDRNVFDNVAFALHVTSTRSAEIKKKTLHVLAKVGLSHRRNSMPHTLSGGEQQRVAIARALVNEPFLLLADEPTGNLDPITSNEILKLLKDINAQGTAILMATHNYDLVKKAQGRIIQIKDRKLIEVQLKR